MTQDLSADLSNVRAQIGAAEARDSRFAGGLVKSLIAVELEVLRTTEALIVQRIHAIESNAPVRMVIVACEVNAERAQKLANELVGLHSKLQGAEARSAQFAGGLVKAMAESEIATTRNTIALLEQQYMAANYGIVIPTASEPQTRGQPGAAVSGSATAGAAGDDEEPHGAGTRAPNELEIESLDSRMMSVNDTYGELAWKVVVKNRGAADRGVTVRFTVLDADEFELDYGIEAGVVPANGSQTVRGKILIDCDKIDRVATNAARVTSD